MTMSGVRQKSKENNLHQGSFATDQGAWSSVRPDLLFLSSGFHNGGDPGFGHCFLVTTVTREQGLS